MNHTTLVCSFLLLVLGTFTTLGTPMKDDHPNGKELEELRSHPDLNKYPERTTNHKESKTNLHLISSDKGSKKANPGLPNVIPGAKLGLTVLTSLLSTLADYKQKIAIGIENKSGYPWTAITVYFRSGTTDMVLPTFVKSGQALLFGARKGSWSLKGVEGVLTYHIPEIKQSLAVMFSVPYDLNLYSNYYDVQLFPGHKVTFKAMYNGKPRKGDSNWTQSKKLGSNLGLGVKCAMSESGWSTLEIHVEKVKAIK